LIILCTHNSGGVGKTTLAIHAAGALIALSEKTLVIDCDEQSDSWQFYSGRTPRKAQDVDTDDNYRTVISNKERKIIKALALKGFDHIVLDIDTPLQNTVQVIIGNNPDLILVPVNKSQEIKALRNLSKTLKVISQLSKPGFSPKVIVVPLGVMQESILEAIDKINAKNKPNSCRVANAMPDLQDKMQLAIYKDRRYIWSYEGYEYLLEYFKLLIKT
jgi:chromosome partitioning protein